jgi:hypothetical protein
MGRESGVARGPGESENSEGYKRGQGRERERERATFTVFCYTGVGRQRHDIFSRLQKRVS